MDDTTIRTLIREKLKDGRLPYDSMPRFWGGPADGEVCDACDKPITKQQLVMEGIALTLSDAPRADDTEWTPHGRQDHMRADRDQWEHEVGRELSSTTADAVRNCRMTRVKITSTSLAHVGGRRQLQ
jgi:hypothetical protein